MRIALGRLLALFVVAAVACGDNSTGRGIKTAQSAPVVRTASVGLVITEVYAPIDDSASHFAELRMDGTEDLSLEGWVLSAGPAQADACTSDTCLDLAGTLGSGARLGLDTSALNLSGSAGELAVLDPEDTVQAYLAWGADPMALGSVLVGRAVAAGLSKAIEPIALPYPMPGSLAVVRESSDEIGCAAPSFEQPATIVECGDGEADLILSELLPALGAGVAPWVELHNAAATPLRLDGARLCVGAECASFARGTQMAGGSFLVAYLGTAGPESPGEGEVTFESVEPPAASADLLLLAPGSGQVANDAESVLSFVRYGAAEGSLASVAVAQGIWPSVEARAMAPRIPGESLALDSARNWSGQAWASNDPPWNPTQPTRGEANQAIGLSSNTWFSCSFPAPWREPPPSMIRIREVTRSSESSVVVVSVATEGDPISLATFSLELGDVSWSFDSEAALASGESLTVWIVAAAEDCPANEPCMSEASVDAAGELSLFEQDALVAHLQWGAAPEGGWSQAASAVTFGVWPLESCASPSLPVGGSLQLQQGLVGRSPSDYTLVTPSGG